MPYFPCNETLDSPRFGYRRDWDVWLPWEKADPWSFCCFRRQKSVCCSWKKHQSSFSHESKKRGSLLQELWQYLLKLYSMSGLEFYSAAIRLKCSFLTSEKNQVIVNLRLPTLFGPMIRRDLFSSVKILSSCQVRSLSTSAHFARQHTWRVELDMIITYSTNTQL